MKDYTSRSVIEIPEEILWILILLEWTECLFLSYFIFIIFDKLLLYVHLRLLSIYALIVSIYFSFLHIAT